MLQDRGAVQVRSGSRQHVVTHRRGRREARLARGVIGEHDNANNATHYVKLGKKRRESFKRNYYIIFSRVIMKAIIIILQHSVMHCNTFSATHCITLHHTAP